MTDSNRSQPPREDMDALTYNMVNIWQKIALVSSDIAHAKRTIFLAYVAEGFTEAQALELVKNV